MCQATTIPCNRGRWPVMGAFTMGLHKKASSQRRAGSSRAKKVDLWLRPGILLAVVGLLSVLCSLFPIPSLAQSPNYGLGRSPSAEEIRIWDITISPSGKELPPGRGTTKEGALFFVQKGC